MTAIVDDRKTTLTLSGYTFRDRPFGSIVDAAQSSCYRGIGLTVGQCVSAVERGIPFHRIPAELEQRGLRLAELELLRMGEQAPVAQLNDLVIELAQLLRPERVHAAAFTGEPDRIAQDLAEMSARLDPIEIAVEFMPYGRIPTLSAAQDLILSVGAPNVKIVLDVLHFFRSGAKLVDLTPERLRDVACVQLSDVVNRADVELSREARHLRTYPGHGTLDIVGFLSKIGDEIGTLPPLSVELVSDALETVNLGVVAEQAMLATATVLDAAGFEFAAGNYVKI